MPKPPFILLVKDIDGVWCYTIYTDLPADDAAELKRKFEQTYDDLYGALNVHPASFTIAPMAECPMKG